MRMTEPLSSETFFPLLTVSRRIPLD